MLVQWLKYTTLLKCIHKSLRLAAHPALHSEASSLNANARDGAPYWTCAFIPTLSNERLLFCISPAEIGVLVEALGS